MLNKIFGILFLMCCWNCHYSNTCQSNINLYENPHDIYVNTNLRWDFSNADIRLDDWDENDYLEHVLDGIEDETSSVIYRKINEINKKELLKNIGSRDVYILLKKEIESSDYKYNNRINWVCDTLSDERVVLLSSFKFNLIFLFRGERKFFENIIYVRYGYINSGQKFYFMITPKTCIWGQIEKIK